MNAKLKFWVFNRFSPHLTNTYSFGTPWDMTGMAGGLSLPRPMAAALKFVSDSAALIDS
jgi:hypothetical protein